MTVMTQRSKPYTQTEWARIPERYREKHRINGLAPPDEWILKLREPPIRDHILTRIKQLDAAGEQQ